MYFFKENIGDDVIQLSSYVTYKDKKILDSRDLYYYINYGL